MRSNGCPLYTCNVKHKYDPLFCFFFAVIWTSNEQALGNRIMVEQLNGGLSCCRGFRPSLHFVCAVEAADWPAPPHRQLIFCLSMPTNEPMPMCKLALAVQQEHTIHVVNCIVYQIPVDQLAIYTALDCNLLMYFVCLSL